MKDWQPVEAQRLVELRLTINDLRPRKWNKKLQNNKRRSILLSSHQTRVSDNPQIYCRSRELVGDEILSKIAWFWWFLLFDDFTTNALTRVMRGFFFFKKNILKEIILKRIKIMRKLDWDLIKKKHNGYILKRLWSSCSDVLYIMNAFFDSWGTNTKRKRVKKT
jgi:hypothetical protein